MKEDQILDITLEILDKKGADEAYCYLVSNYALLESDENPGAQFYNFLYCLSALSGRKEEALDWVWEAVIDRKYWYRPEGFEDGDLTSLRDDAAFKEYVRVSEERYREVLKAARTLCTWDLKDSEKIALVLHGNQQNYCHGRPYWDQLASSGYQVEYVQSAIPDSAGLYRWEDDSELQLNSVLSVIPWETYEERLLCGFSAGCNEILRTLIHQKPEIKSLSGYQTNRKTCEAILLVAPWIPVIKERMDELLDVIESQQISVRIVCGREDEDYAPLVEKFSRAASGRNMDYEVTRIKGMGHRYPDEIIRI